MKGVLPSWVKEINREEGREEGEIIFFNLAFKFKLKKIKEGEWRIILYSFFQYC